METCFWNKNSSVGNLLQIFWSDFNVNKMYAQANCFFLRMRSLGVYEKWNEYDTSTESTANPSQSSESASCDEYKQFITLIRKAPITNHD
jgi:hypothetical protein